MSFDMRVLREKLGKDNPNFERDGDLRRLVDKLGRPFQAKDIAAEMKKISPEMWRNKYPFTRFYLEGAILDLKGLLRAAPTGWTTVRMEGKGDGLSHDFTWKSDTGSLADLEGVDIREHVTWQQWPEPLLKFLRPDSPIYKSPNQHFGQGVTNPALRPPQHDAHTWLGPFGMDLLKYQGEPLRAPMDQVYEYSYHAPCTSPFNWVPIPNSAYSIVREVSLVGGRVQITLTKTSKTISDDMCSISKIW